MTPLLDIQHGIQLEQLLGDDDWATTCRIFVRLGGNGGLGTSCYTFLRGENTDAGRLGGVV